MQTEAVKYTQMQKSFYDDSNLTTEQIVGYYGFHEIFPYETLLLFQNGDLRRPIFDNFLDKTALDIGCGEGRMVRRMSHLFKHIDGCDISEKMLNSARLQTPQSNFYITNGLDCGNAPKNHYDFVYNTISLQHICCFDVRNSIIKNAFECLKEGGKATFQFTYSATPNENHATWYQNKFDATSTNSGCDVLISKQELDDVICYFEKIFNKVSFWFWDISTLRNTKYNNRHPNGHCDDSYWATHFILIHCEKY